ncbi:type II toxin-antitoxin system RelE/ParE family toxin [Streptomyces sp. NPDC057909]|uniref:type II toxin-antitoxin system RelE family toxin n=1 Tax=Streptomyces sp. NPDC057909 TaxID=3346277 RepID=UPI0036E34438
MSWSVTWEPTALNEAAGHLKADPAGVDALLHATDRLADDPAPEGSLAWGSSHRRLHSGPWRILYRIDVQNSTLHIEHVGHTG